MNMFSRISIYSGIVALAGLTGCIVDPGYGNDGHHGRDDTYQHDRDDRYRNNDRNNRDDRDDRHCNERDSDGHCRDGNRHDG